MKENFENLLVEIADTASNSVESSENYLNDEGVDFEDYLEKGFNEFTSKNEITVDVTQTLTKSQNFFRRLVLAAKITDECHGEWTFGKVKFQKLVYLCEEVSRMNFSTNYSKQAAGPFDNKFMHSIKKQFENHHWFSVELVKKGKYSKYSFSPLDKKDSYKEYYDRYFAEDSSNIMYILDLFKSTKTDQVELVATIYSCWKELLDKNSIITAELITDLVYKWHEEKKKFTQKTILETVEWMKEKGLHPS